MSGPSLAAASFRDPSGFVYEREGRIRRQVNRLARDDYDRLIGSGLYDELADAGALIRHEDDDAAPERPEIAYKVIRPEPVAMLSYPYEWSFSQYQDAALLTLDVQRRAITRGMSLKDASAYNVQFHRGRPVFIDTLSFQTYREGEPWAAYRQFCQHFLAPLALMSRVDVRLNQLCRTNLDGVPLSLATRLLPWRARLTPGLSLHLDLHGAFDRSAATAEARAGSSRRFGKTAMLGLIDHLETTVRKLHWKPQGSHWASYYEENSYSDEEMDRKARLVEECLDLARPETVWDLGANTGRFSRIAAGRGISTVAIEADPACVESAYLQAKADGETRLLPLWIDLFNPSPGIGWANRERFALFDRGRPDLLLALAIVHHLAIAGNLPLENLARFFPPLAPWLAIEFVSPEDSQARRLIAQHQGVHHPYDQEHFEKCFSTHYAIQRALVIAPNRRVLYLMRRRDQSGDSSTGS